MPVCPTCGLDTDRRDARIDGDMFADFVHKLFELTNKVDELLARQPPKYTAPIPAIPALNSPAGILILKPLK